MAYADVHILFPENDGNMVIANTSEDVEGFEAISTTNASFKFAAGQSELQGFSHLEETRSLDVSTSKFPLSSGQLFAWGVQDCFTAQFNAGMSSGSFFPEIPVSILLDSQSQTAFDLIDERIHVMRNTLFCLERDRPWSSLPMKSEPLLYSQREKTSHFLGSFVESILSSLLSVSGTTDLGKLFWEGKIHSNSISALVPSLASTIIARRRLFRRYLQKRLLSVSDMTQNRANNAITVELINDLLAGLNGLLLYIGLICRAYHAANNQLRSQTFTHSEFLIPFSRGIEAFAQFEKDWVDKLRIENYGMSSDRFYELQMHKSLVSSIIRQQEHPMDMAKRVGKELIMDSNDFMAGINADWNEAINNDIVETAKEIIEKMCIRICGTRNKISNMYKNINDTRNAFNDEIKNDFKNDFKYAINTINVMNEIKNDFRNAINEINVIITFIIEVEPIEDLIKIFNEFKNLIKKVKEVNGIKISIKGLDDIEISTNDITYLMNMLAMRAKEVTDRTGGISHNNETD
jgi:hypothetical protein